MGSTINDYLHIFKTASHGEDVRDALVASITLCYNDATTGFPAKPNIETDIDFDTVNDAGVYVIYSGHTYTNGPSFYTNGAAFLMVLTNPAGAQKIQLLVERNSGKWAYRYYMGNRTPQWQPWVEYLLDSEFSDSSINPLQNKVITQKFTTIDSDLDRSFKSQPNIETDIDFDTVNDAGVYVIYSGHTYTNGPSFYTNGAAFLMVLTNPAGAQKIQLLVERTSGKWAYRYYMGNRTPQWQPWVEYDIYDKTEKFSCLRGKKLSIIGDSISTFSGYSPEGYSTYFPRGDVTNVNQTWWKRLVDKTGMTLLRDAAWSGSGVCDRGTLSDTAFVAYRDARINDLSNGTDKPDIIIVFIGTNDFKYSRPLGTIDWNSEFPSTETSIGDFKSAYGAMLNSIRTKYPAAHVYCCKLLNRVSANDPGDIYNYPILNSGGVSISAYNQAIEDVANWTSCEIINLNRLFPYGYTDETGNIRTFTVDGLHPNSEGHRIIANAVLNSLLTYEQELIL